MSKTKLIFQFQIDYRPAGPKRDDWMDAARDAVETGYATWLNEDQIALSEGASIERFYVPSN